MAFFILRAGLELVELVAVHIGKRLHLLYAANPQDLSLGNVEGEISADALLGQDLRETFLPAGGDIEKEAFRVEPAGEANQMSSPSIMNSLCVMPCFRPKPVMIFVFRSRTLCRSPSSTTVGKMRLLAANASGRSK